MVTTRPVVPAAVARPELAIVIGGASCVWDDVTALEDMLGHEWDGMVVAANDSGAHWPRPLHHWATLHAEKMPRWITLRAYHGFAPCEGEYFGVDKHGRGQNIPPITYFLKEWPGGSSGLLAVQAAQAAGAKRVILCGVPMTPTPHFVETHENHVGAWLAYIGHWKAWPRHAPKMFGWVRSMSGNTRELFGAPDVAWLTAPFDQQQVPDGTKEE